jgi:hypothetical protein
LTEDALARRRLAAVIKQTEGKRFSNFEGPRLQYGVSYQMSARSAEIGRPIRVVVFGKSGPSTRAYLMRANRPRMQ